MGSRQEGTVIAGRYRLGQLLARGGMGSIWAARHQELEVDPAIKLCDVIRSPSRGLPGAPLAMLVAGLLSGAAQALAAPKEADPTAAEALFRERAHPLLCEVAAPPEGQDFVGIRCARDK